MHFNVWNFGARLPITMNNYKKGDLKMNRKRMLGVFVVTLMLVIGLTPLLAQANIGHGSPLYMNTTCSICGESNVRIKYGCTNSFKLDEASKPCTYDPNCTYYRTQYYTCYRHVNADATKTYCHSDRFTYNIHKITHFRCNNSSGCVY